MKKKILIIDDEPDVITYLRTFLKDQGYNVCCAEDVESGLQMIPAEKPDVICLDIMMPEKSGISFYDQIRKHIDYCHIPVVIISGLNEDSMDSVLGALEHTCQPSRPYRFVSKPVDLEQLLSTIREALG
ncbi:MAG: response regulator [Deltaproteobacteria bacterium]|nr:response regulator [Deltaproteobacteria bacterium]